MSDNDSILPCVVIGAGMSGLVAATPLQEQGIPVVVLDKGRGVGGRMATRRIADAVFDHGAQFFTVRDPRFAELVSRWQSQGVVSEWARGFANVEGVYRGDGHLRYRGSTGMTAAPKCLAQALDVRVRTRVAEIRAEAGTWSIRTDDGQHLRCQQLVMTPPVPQSLALLGADRSPIPAEARHALASITYDPCIALMALLDKPSRIPEPGGMQIDHGPITWIADNTLKGISPDAHSVTIHTDPQFSRQHWQTDDDQIVRLLMDAAQEWIGTDIRTYQIHRWLFSKPTTLYPEACLYVPTPSPIVFAGDAFAGPRVEGAAISGLAAAEKLLSASTDRP